MHFWWLLILWKCHKIDLFLFHFQLWGHIGFRGFFPDSFLTIFSFFRRQDYYKQLLFEGALGERKKSSSLKEKGSLLRSACAHQWVSDTRPSIWNFWVIPRGGTFSWQHYHGGILTCRKLGPQQSSSYSSELSECGWPEDTQLLCPAHTPVLWEGTPEQLTCRAEPESSQKHAKRVFTNEQVENSLKPDKTFVDKCILPYLG